MSRNRCCMVDACWPDPASPEPARRLIGTSMVRPPPANQNRPAASATPPAMGLAGCLKRWLDLRRGRWELMRLDDLQLWDIGLTRAQARSVRVPWLAAVIAAWRRKRATGRGGRSDAGPLSLD